MSQTILLVPLRPDPECRVDQDCSSKLACIDERCQNPCQINNPCTGNQKCVVSDTLPTRTVACVCPEGTVFSDRGNCQKGKRTKIVLDLHNLFFCNTTIQVSNSVTFRKNEYNYNII